MNAAAKSRTTPWSGASTNRHTRFNKPPRKQAALAEIMLAVAVMCVGSPVSWGRSDETIEPRDG